MGVPRKLQNTDCEIYIDSQKVLVWRDKLSALVRLTRTPRRHRRAFFHYFRYYRQCFRIKFRTENNAVSEKKNSKKNTPTQGTPKNHQKIPKHPRFHLPSEKVKKPNYHPYRSKITPKTSFPIRKTVIFILQSKKYFCPVLYREPERWHRACAQWLFHVFV